MIPRSLLVVLSLLLIATPVAAQAPTPTGGELEPVEEVIRTALQVANQAAQEVGDVLDDTTNPGGDQEEEAPPGTGDGGDAGSDGLLAGLLDALSSRSGLFAMGVLGLAGLGAAGFLMATRYVDPKEALENPQRAMLYGYIRGNPGVNLKTLSDDFDMKTSTVLWHIRKLEGAELVRSTKANGFRVFYPVEGGIEAKQLGSAVAALANDNASRILDYVTIHPGVAQKGLVSALDINAGTVRWHLRKLKDTGLMAELSQGRTSTYYPTDLGVKALRQTTGLSAEVKPLAPFVTEASALPQ